MKIVIISVLLSIIAGFGGGWTYQATLGGKNATTTTTSGTEATTSTTNKTQTLAECLTEVWGADKYAAISANSSLATTDDNLASLKCYN